MTNLPTDKHIKGCAFCPTELLGVQRDSNGDPLCNTCPHLQEKESA